MTQPGPKSPEPQPPPEKSPSTTEVPSVPPPQGPLGTPPEVNPEPTPVNPVPPQI